MDVSLELAAGEFLTILGPSGSGKTTLLKLVAGFEIPDSGEVIVDDKDVTALDPARRNIGMVFQNYALFPHMTVARNVAFPLQMRGVPSAEIGTRVSETLDLVGLSAMSERLPKQLSGGQQQRVALARAIVFRPTLLLLDEPFGALDRKLRELMQLEVRRLQRQLGLTTLFITHDQEEALIMSDRIAVMDHGRLQQVGLPHEIYEAPANTFVADFIGESNILVGVVEQSDHGTRLRLEGGPPVEVLDGLTAAHSGRTARVLVRPERFFDASTRTPNGIGTNRIDGTVVESIYIGISDKYRVRTPDGLEVLARLNAGKGERRYNVGDAVRLGFDSADARLIEIR
jgi:putative spermidine/putrescine transport system ATP-binding protein